MILASVKISLQEIKAPDELTKLSASFRQIIIRLSEWKPYYI